MSADPRPNEIRLTRVYEAAVKDVWDAWTDPEQVAQWWGPRGFTLTTHAKDLRPGGIWDYTMHGPDGTNYPNRTYYHVVEDQRRLVYDHGASDDRPPLFRVTALFSESGGSTVLELTMAFATAGQAAASRKFIRDAGGNATWDRLAEFLCQRIAARPCFVINFSLDAPRDAVFRMWTEPADLEKWLPPSGFRMEFLRSGISAGQSSFCRMSNREGVTICFRMDYREIVSPSRLVYFQQFCDSGERVCRHPALPDWPETQRVTVDFTEEGPGATRVTLQSEPSGGFTADEVQAFLDTRSAMTQGWSGSFSQLESMLAESGAGRPQAG